MKGLRCSFLHYAFRAWVRQRILKLIFHTIIDECPQISFVYKESTVHFSEKNCDVTHHKSYGSELTAVIELRNHIVYILFSYTYGFTIYYV